MTEPTIISHKTGDIAVYPETGSVVRTANDFLGLLYGAGTTTIALHKNRLPEDFFDLKNGLAGEFLQKVSNYRKRLIILGDFSAVESKSLKDFIYESNKNREVLFVSSVDEALALLG